MYESRYRVVKIDEHGFKVQISEGSLNKCIDDCRMLKDMYRDQEYDVEGHWTDDIWRSVLRK